MVSQTQPSLTQSSPRWLQASFWVLASLLFALVQIPWRGYQLGVGNQGIQIAFLQALHDPHLYSRDIMVTSTLGSYPSFFFHLCARLLWLMDLPTLYLTLHILATTGVFLVVAALAKAVTRNPLAAVVCMLLLVAGHHQALAGEGVYSTGFTHTWAVFPLSLLSLVLFFRERYVMAFFLAGVIFNLHALEAGHLFFIMGFASLCLIRRVGFGTLVIAGALFTVAASPTLVVMVQQHQQFNENWLQLMHIRSNDHSFPSSWWTQASDIPRYICILGLAAVAMGFRIPRRSRSKIALLAAAVGILFLIGWIYTDIYPVATIVRGQLFRSSRLLIILAMVVIAHGCVVGWRMPWKRSAKIPLWAAWLEFVSATFTALAIAIPSMATALPLALAVAMIVALITGRLAWYESLFAGCVLLVCFVAYQSIGLPNPVGPLLSPWVTLTKNNGPSLEGYGWLLGALLVVAVGVAIFAARRSRPVLSSGVFAGGMLVALLTLVLLTPIVRRNSEPDAAWFEAQRFAFKNTPANALFLTPARVGSSFRILSQRATVGEWRDGTQLYFNAAFGPQWWNRMLDIQPGIVKDASQQNLLNPGRALDKLTDEEIIKVAQQYGADYVVLPHNDTLLLDKVYDNNVWAIYRPKTVSLTGGPSDASLVEEDRFLRSMAMPNIEKYRKSDASLTIVDASGKPVNAAECKITQTGSSFGFGVSLPFFKTPTVDTKADYKPPEVTKDELSRFLETFNYSMIAFSSQWRFTEPSEGRLDYADLDRYVDWCAQNSVRPEIHFVSGYQPAWAKSKGTGVNKFMLDRAEGLAKRYGEKVFDWQVISEDVGTKASIDQAVNLFASMRQLMPKARLGISDDARFWSVRPAAQAKEDMFRGLELLKTLKSKGATVDYFGFEAKHPMGLWAGARQIYSALDAYAKEGVKIHVTEFGVAVGDPIEGDVMKGRWTPELQANYYERFFTICFSHPEVEAINVIGISPTTWIEGQGLLDEKYQPTPAFTKLKDLITQRWRTKMTSKTGVDGAAVFNGYHGRYELAMTLPGGKVVTALFDVERDKPNNFRFVLNSAAGTLTRSGAQ